LFVCEVASLCSPSRVLRAFTMSSSDVQLEPFPSLSPSSNYESSEQHTIRIAKPKVRRKSSNGLPGEPRGDTGAPAMATIAEKPADITQSPLVVCSDIDSSSSEANPCVSIIANRFRKTTTTFETKKSQVVISAVEIYLSTAYMAESTFHHACYPRSLLPESDSSKPITSCDLPFIPYGAA